MNQLVEQLAVAIEERKWARILAERHEVGNELTFGPAVQHEARRLQHEGARALRAKVQRHLMRIGVNQAVEHTWLFEWLVRLRRQHATLELALGVDTTDALDDAMANADIDLAVASRPLGDRDVEKRQLPSLSMAFVGSAARHRGDTYPLEAIARCGLVTFHSGSRVHRNLLKLLKSADIEGCRVDLFSSIPSIIKAVQEGFGVATLPERLVAQAPQHRLRVLPCDATLPPLPVWLSWPAEQGRDASAVVASMLAFTDDSLT